MLKTRALFMIALSLGLGGVAAWMAGNWIERAETAEQLETTPVVAASIEIPFGTSVARRHLKVLEMPAGVAPPGAFRSPDEVLGRVTVQPIMAGEILMQGRFVDHDDGSTLAALVGENKRAVTVRVNDVIGVAGFLLPGNRVDVLAARREANRRASAETVLRNIKVLAVDQTAATEKNEPVIVRAVTLEVSPEQAETLVKAREEGAIQLTLRNPNEADEPVQAEVEPEPEPEPEAEPAPAPRRVVAPRRTNRSITVIRGTVVSTEESES